MTDENPIPHERIAPGEYVTAPAHADDWEGVGRRAVATLLDAAIADLRNEADLTTGDVRRGETVTIDHVSRLRRTLDAVEYAIEAHLAALADEAEPWEIEMADGTDYERPRFTRVRCDCYSDDYDGCDRYSCDYNDSGPARNIPAAGMRGATRTR